ncbi:uncharacterized protein [Physcomitrium patens]|uniref:uncharacterized protein n=1 Tax=Physcomitrium patens TaxID=3218 RepID=UPI003CCD1260
MHMWGLLVGGGGSQIHSSGIPVSTSASLMAPSPPLFLHHSRHRLLLRFPSPALPSPPSSYHSKHLAASGCRFHNCFDPSMHCAARLWTLGLPKVYASLSTPSFAALQPLDGWVDG